MMIESLVLKNSTIEDQININKTEGEYWLDSVDFGQAENNIHTFKFVDQIGETVYNTTLEPRQIQITGWVAAWSEERVHELKVRLNHFVNPKHLIEVYANKMRIEVYPRTSVKYSVTYKENNELMCKFLITGYCPYPLFTDENERAVSVSYTERLFRFPLVIPKDEGIMMGIRQPSLIAEIENTGDLPVGYIIEIHAYGEVYNPVLIDIGTQKFIKINRTMQDGEKITIDTREGYRKITGVYEGREQNYFKYRDYDSSWLSLERGYNYIRYNADLGVKFMEVYIRFNPGYLEIDQ